jgi:hypothetical protein
MDRETSDAFDQVEDCINKAFKEITRGFKEVSTQLYALNKRLTELENMVYDAAAERDMRRQADASAPRLGVKEVHFSSPAKFTLDGAPGPFSMPRAPYDEKIEALKAKCYGEYVAEMIAANPDWKDPHETDGTGEQK